jgi:fructose 1,6-bisphosphate aldolase/phosphatase
VAGTLARRYHRVAWPKDGAADGARAPAAGTEEVDVAMKELTFTIIKADCGSVGGHTRPTDEMVRVVEQHVSRQRWAIDHIVTYTGDDIAIITTHAQGTNSSVVHSSCRAAFDAAAEVAKREGNYGAGQDLFATAPSGNVRGTGPGVAELTFKLLPSHRPAESIAVFAADKCGPGAYNMPLYYSFADPSRSSGFLLSPDIGRGFTFVIEDMDHRVEKGARPTHRQIRLNTPEDNVAILALLRDIDRYGVAKIISRAFPDETGVVASTDRLHNITGTYQGKDDPVMIVRNQRIFPALEEVVDPFRHTPLVTGDARGSHTMPLMPVPLKTPVAGAYCLPIVSCMALSVNGDGMFSRNAVDVFENLAWDRYRGQAQERADWMRMQTPFGVGMASQEEIAYTGLAKLHERLDREFKIVADEPAAPRARSASGASRNGARRTAAPVRRAAVRRTASRGTRGRRR